MTAKQWEYGSTGKSILRTNEFTVLYDKGYHTGSELKIAQDLGIETIVAIPGAPSTSQAPNHDYNSENFKYNKEADTYTCPRAYSKNKRDVA